MNDILRIGESLYNLIPFTESDVKKAGKISAIALGIFSYYVNYRLFLPCFITGIYLGIAGNASNSHSHLHSDASCSPLEHLTGVNLPMPVKLFSSIAITFCHIDHHPTVFVPIVAVSLGNWLGNSIKKKS